MAAYNVGRMCLFICSILWDLNIPQEAATLAYKDNDGCTSMGNAQKPTPRTRHIDITYFALCDWIEWDLIILERIDTSINSLTAIGGHDRQFFNKLRSTVVSRRIFIRLQSLIAR